MASSSRSVVKCRHRGRQFGSISAWLRVAVLTALAAILIHDEVQYTVAFSSTSQNSLRKGAVYFKRQQLCGPGEKSYRSIRLVLSTPIDLGGAKFNNLSSDNPSLENPLFDNHENPLFDNQNRTEITTIPRQNLALTSVAAGMAFLFWRIISLSGPGSWRYFLAGGICAATSHAIPTPIDVVKTRKQVDPDLQGKSFLQAAHEISRKEGVHSLLAGLGPTTFGYLLEGAIKFGVYEALKPVVKSVLAMVAGASGMKVFNSQLIAFVLSGGVAGTAASIMLCPMEALRIRLVSEPNFAPGGWLEGGYKMVKNEGVFGLFKGVQPMIQKQVPYTITKNVSFDYLTRLAYGFVRANGLVLSHFTLFLIPFTSAMIASVLSCISSQPGDMLLSLVNAHEGDKRTGDFAKEILRSDLGVRGFFVGMQDRLLHVGVIVTLQLLIYDFVKRLCGIAATGSC